MGTFKSRLEQIEKKIITKPLEPLYIGLYAENDKVYREMQAYCCERNTIGSMIHLFPYLE